MEGIIPLYRKDSGCDYHRVLMPLKHMGVDVDSVLVKNLSDLLADARLVVFNRWPGFAIEHLLRAKKKYGFKIVVDLDDYWFLYPNHIMYNNWKKSNMPQKILESLMNSDMVTVTNPKLAAAVQQYNRNVEVLPNALPFDTGQFKVDKVKDQDDKRRIFYAGGSSHFWDMRTLKGVFDKLAAGPQDFKIVLGGYNADNPASKKLWSNIESLVTSKGRAKYYMRLESFPVENYMEHYKYCDISLAPLEENYFNSFKSNIKGLESGAVYAPLIASKWTPYEDLSEVIQMAAKPIEWYALLNGYLKCGAMAKDHGLALGEFVRKHFHLNTVNEKRRQVYEYLINK